MEDWAREWSRYLESRMTDARADLRARSTITVPSAFALLVGSILFIDTSGDWVLGLIGLGFAVLVLVGSIIYNLKSFVFTSGCDGIIRRILIGRFKESAEVNKEFNELIAKYSAKSAIAEGLEAVRHTAGRQS